MSTEYDQLREKIRNISTEAPTSTKKAAKQLMGDPLKSPEGVENGYIAAWKEKEKFYREYTPVKLNELFADIKQLTAVHGIEDREYLKALENLILKYNGE
ncbi:hypothetical protein [Gracilibacillus dipsosauri]|uniref:hypothetical protein n=1 Tax=Gracilibacillus dipsosauri TaxID=178340 RepID=UPI00240A2361